MPITVSTGCLWYTSRLKSCLWGTLPKSMLCTLSVGCFSYTSRIKWFLRGTSVTNPGWNSAYWNSSHKPKPSTLYRIFHLHIQAKIIPTENFSPKPMPRMLSTGCFLHILAEMVPTENSSYKPTPSMLCMGCLFYTCRFKLCSQWSPPGNPHSHQDVSLTHPGWNRFYRELLSQIHAQRLLYRKIPLYIQTEMVPMRNSHKLMPTLLSMFLLHIHGELSHNPMPSTLSTQCFSKHIQAEMLPTGDSSTKPCPVHSSGDLSLTHAC